MNSSLLNVYSNVYSVALMQDVKKIDRIATAKKVNETRFSKLVKLLGRA